MPKPQPKPVQPEELPALVLAVMKNQRFPMLASVDGDQARVRPVTATWNDGYTVYFANLKRFKKTAEMTANPHVELCYLDQNDDQVRITGVAELVTERATLEEAFKRDALLRQYLGGPDNPEFTLWRVRPTRVRFMREWALDYFEVPIE
jgi:general stress protein 26